MRIPLRAWLIALALSLACGGFAIACPQWTRDLGLDVWNSGLDGEELAANGIRSRRLDAVSERVKKRLELKQYVIAGLIGGRMELEDATGQFEELNQLEPELTSTIRMYFDGADDREKTARQVIAFTRSALDQDPSRQEIVVRRLESRLRMMKGQTPAEQVE